MARRFDDIKRSSPAPAYKAARVAPPPPPEAPRSSSATGTTGKQGPAQPAAPIFEKKTVKPLPSTLPPQDYFSALASHSVHGASRGNGARNVAEISRVAAAHVEPFAREEEGGHSDRLNIPFTEPKKPRRRHTALLVACGILAIALGVFFGLNYFASATISITPQQETATVSGTFSATRSGDGENGQGLAFETMTVPGEVSDEISAEEERKVDERASGTVVVYNNYGAAAQRLIKNTRFETPDGKIFRAKDSIVVPGTTAENGKTVPGSVEAVIVADEPGEKYNIGLTDFTIPGFKGDPRYAKFYARSKTETTGGFSGVKKFPSQEAIDAVRATLRRDLTEKLAKSAQAQKPAGYVLFADASRATLAEDPHIAVDGSRATITESGVVTAMIMKRDALSRFILQKSLASFTGGDVDVPDLEGLAFAFAPADQSLAADTLTFTLAGSVRAIWRVDTDGLARAIAGKPKKDFTAILSGFANIRRAEAAISPFWLFDFPSDPARIKATLLSE